MITCSLAARTHERFHHCLKGVHDKWGMGWREADHRYLSDFRKHDPCSLHIISGPPACKFFLFLFPDISIPNCKPRPPQPLKFGLQISIQI